METMFYPADEELDVSTQDDDAIEDDGTPVLDEEDLEENDLLEEDADEIVWDEPAQNKGSSGSEEKDITV